MNYNMKQITTFLESKSKKIETNVSLDDFQNDKWLADKKKESEEKKKQEQENIKATIKRMEDELNKLKELVKNEDN